MTLSVSGPVKETPSVGMMVLTQSVKGTCPDTSTKYRSGHFTAEVDCG
jgi:hypothetical protein